MLYFDDHPPPHIHVKYQNFEASVLIETGEVNVGKLPPRVQKLVRKWLSQNKRMILEQWNRMERGEQIQRVLSTK